MNRDPYAVLGVNREATQDQIRVAYRKLAKDLHPDLNPGDKKAEEKFKEVASAYDILGDAEKRGRFDPRGQRHTRLRAPGAPRRQGRPHEHSEDDLNRDERLVSAAPRFERRCNLAARGCARDHAGRRLPRCSR